MKNAVQSKNSGKSLFGRRKRTGSLHRSAFELMFASFFLVMGRIVQTILFFLWEKWFSHCFCCPSESDAGVEEDEDGIMGEDFRDSGPEGERRLKNRNILFGSTSVLDLCRLPVQFFPSKMSISSTSHGLETIKDLCIVRETKKISEIRLQKLPAGGFPKIQLFAVQNRCNLDTSSPSKSEGNVYRKGYS